MKKYCNIIFIILLIGYVFSSTACNDMERNSLTYPSSKIWYSSEQEIQMSLNDLYRDIFWPLDSEAWTDDYNFRETNHDILNGTLNGQNTVVEELWENQYKAITRANTILANMERAKMLGISDERIRQFTAEALFMRACMYSRLISHFGDVVYSTEIIDIDEAFDLGRNPKSEIIPKIYQDFDNAAANLPVAYLSGDLQRATKGAAYALKSRFALFNGDWRIAAEAANNSIELNVYKLHDNFANLFLTSTRNSPESVFLLPRSITNNISLGNSYVMNKITRNAGGWAAQNPSWELLASFLCTDGLPIDKSPLFNPQQVFKNRDPRCTMTIVEFNTPHLGFIYDPHPDALEVLNLKTGKMQTNNDNRANTQYASFNALVWKKGIDGSYLENGKDADPDKIIIRYADVLLIYAEAKIELDEIDDGVLDVMNQVRARAYDAKVEEIEKYPPITEKDQAILRKILRYERRMEFANEGLRYMDLIRWRIAEKALSKKNYGILFPASLLRERITSRELWFWPEAPDIDDDGIPDFSRLENNGQIAVLSKRSWNNRQYLWPIPTKDILINKNLKQNTGY